MFVIYEACTVDYNLEKGDNLSIIKRVKNVTVCVYIWGVVRNQSV